MSRLANSVNSGSRIAGNWTYFQPGPEPSANGQKLPKEQWPAARCNYLVEILGFKEDQGDTGAMKLIFNATVIDSENPEVLPGDELSYVLNWAQYGDSKTATMLGWFFQAIQGLGGMQWTEDQIKNSTILTWILSQNEQQVPPNLRAWLSQNNLPAFNPLRGVRVMVICSRKRGQTFSRLGMRQIGANQQVTLQKQNWGGVAQQAQQNQPQTQQNQPQTQQNGGGMPWQQNQPQTQQNQPQNGGGMPWQQNQPQTQQNGGGMPWQQNQPQTQQNGGGMPWQQNQPQTQQNQPQTQQNQPQNGGGMPWQQNQPQTQQNQPQNGGGMPWQQNQPQTQQNQPQNGGGMPAGLPQPIPNR